jgi:predicted SAM-dependent methyltransferase
MSILNYSKRFTKKLMTIKQRFGNWFRRQTAVNWRTISLLRFEWQAFGTRVLNRLSPFIRRTRRGLANQRHLNVNLGSGGRGREGWVNIDVARHHKDIAFPYDIRTGMPFAKGQVARIFAEHVVEHIEFREDVPRLLRSMWDVLEPGGRVRIVVPDCERYLEAYVTRDPAKWEALGVKALPQDMPTHMAMINHQFHQGGEHMFGYDFETLQFVLLAAGFAEVRKMAYGMSGDSDLCLDREEHAEYSLYVEARKEYSESE